MYHDSSAVPPAVSHALRVLHGAPHARQAGAHVVFGGPQAHHALRQQGHALSGHQRLQLGVSVRYHLASQRTNRERMENVQNVITVIKNKNKKKTL